MYYDIYTLVQNAIYGTTALTGWQDMFLTIISSCAVLFAFAVPFIIVWRIIKLFIGR